MTSFLISRQGSDRDTQSSTADSNNTSGKTVVSIVLEPDRKDSTRSKKNTQQTQLVTLGISHLLSNLYALVLVLFGIIFPLSEALQNYWLQSHYNGIFVVYIYVVATVFLLYLQFYLIPASHRQQHELEKEQKSGQTNNSINMNNITNNVVLRNPQKVDISSLKGFENEIVPAITRSDTYRRQNSIATGQDLDQSKLKKDVHDGSYDTGINSNTSLKSDDSSTGSDISGLEETSHVWIGLDSLKNLFAHDGSSFYLRIGVLVFGIGNLIYIGLEIDFQFSTDMPSFCNDDPYGWTFILCLIFVIVQTFFLFKNAEVHVTVQEGLTRFGFKHLIATNICIWIRTLIHEILEHAHHIADHDSHDNMPTDALDVSNVTNMTAEPPVDCEEYRELLINASPYLFPFVLEYSLIAAGIFAIMSAEIGHGSSVDIMSNLKHVLNHHSQNNPLNEDEDSQALYNYAGPLHTHSGKIDLTSSHRGMFLGFLCLAGALVTSILFFNDVSSDDLESAQLTYIVADTALEVVLLIATIMGLYSMNKLALNAKPLGVDDILLLIALAGSFLFEISIVVSTAFYLEHDSTSHEDGEGVEYSNTYLIVLSLVSSVLACVQILLQAILIISGLRRYSATKQQENAKPGKEAITFLVVTNVTFWIFGMAQIKNLELGIQEEFYGTLAWLFILNLNLPLYLFFRFHSSVCLADVWNVAYRSVNTEFTFTKSVDPLPILTESQSRHSSISAGQINNAFSHHPTGEQSLTNSESKQPGSSQSNVRL